MWRPATVPIVMRMQAYTGETSTYMLMAYTVMAYVVMVYIAMADGDEDSGIHRRHEPRFQRRRNRTKNSYGRIEQKRRNNE